MGFWNAIGRWLVWAVGLLLVVIGSVAVWNGLDIVQMERGWTAVIAGTIALSAGILTILVGILIDRLEALRGVLLAHRALQVVDAAEVAGPEPTGYEAEPEPPRPIEVPVEPMPGASPAGPASNFSFRTFGKRPGMDLPPSHADEPDAATAPAEVAAPSQDLPPDQIRRFAPPQFRRPSIVPPPVEVSSVPPPPDAEPMPEPPVEVSVEAATEALVEEELHLPRATPFAPLRPVKMTEADVEALAEPAPVTAAPVEETPAPTPHRAVAQAHEWLEKALAGEEDAEPGLDWLRQRRSGEERKQPSFMRRHTEAEAEAEPIAEPQEPSAISPPEGAQAEPVAEAGPSVVGRYSANGSEYTLYANGTIDAQTPLGPRHFGTMDELRQFLEKQNVSTDS